MNLNNFYNTKSLPLNLSNKNLLYYTKIYFVFLRVMANIKKSLLKNYKLTKKILHPITGVGQLTRNL